jgi:putative CocE/NonD family hydrolase
MIGVAGARCFQAMVPMRDGVRLNTFVYLPESRDASFPVILQRTPYGITTIPGVRTDDPTSGWLPDPNKAMFGPLLRGWHQITQRGYAAVYQDCRGRFGSEGVDRIYADDARDGYDTLEWIAGQSWSNQRVGLSGSSGAATTALAAASQGHPTVQALFEQVGSSSIYDDVVYEGQSIEMERLWLWVANNIPGLSDSHRDAVRRRTGLTADQLAEHASSAEHRHGVLDAARNDDPPYVQCPEWMRLPLTGHPDFAMLQPQLDDLLRHPIADEFRRAHNFRSTINVPGFHVTTWFDVFATSVIATFQEVQARVGDQHLWIGPNAHNFVYETQFWPSDPYFEWFDHWLKDKPTSLVDQPPVYYSPRAWVADESTYTADDWIYAEHWPPPGRVQKRRYLCGDGTISNSPAGEPASFRYDPQHPVPSMGGRNLLIVNGMQDQRPAQRHADYGLIYLDAPLTAPLTLAGPVRAAIHLSSDCPDTDLVVKLVDRHPDGRAMLVVDGICRAMTRHGKGEPLSPGEPVELPVDLGDVAHTFAVGHRVEIDVSSSNFPRHNRNTNSGNLIVADDGEADIRVARNTIHHGAAHPSVVVLTVQPA